MTGSSASPDRVHAQTEETTETTTEGPVPATDSDRPTISVTGTAKVNVKPDTAHLSMGVRHRADKAKAALDTVSTKTADLIKTLTDAGIAKQDIQTTGLSVYPHYGNLGDKITGYEASNSVTLKSTDLEGLGALIDQVSGIVGDNFTMDGISFSVGDPDAALADVRGDAVGDARTKAEQYVGGEGLSVGSILRIVENGSAQPPIPYEELAFDRAAGASVPIEPGQQELSVTVTVTFELA